MKYGSVGDVAAKVISKEHIDCRTKQKRRLQVAGLQPFYIPARVPENNELITPVSQNVVVDTPARSERRWDVAVEPKASESSLSTAATSSSRTSVEPYSSSSMTGSIISLASCDQYGWEESLSRKTSVEVCSDLKHAKTMPITTNSVEHKPIIKVDTISLPTKHTSRTRGLIYKVLHPSSPPLTSS